MSAKIDISQYTFLLLKRGIFTKVYGPLDNIEKAAHFFRQRGFSVKAIGVPPALDTLRSWKRTGLACSADGCPVKGFESCSHGFQSWLNIYESCGRPIF